LIERGAKLDILNINGLAPTTIARVHRSYAVAQALNIKPKFYSLVVGLKSQSDVSPHFVKKLQLCYQS